MTSRNPTLALSLLCAAQMALAGCRDAGGGFRLEEAVAAADPALTFPGEGETADVEVDDERRRAVVAPLAAWSWRGRVPRQAVLSLGVQRVPGRRRGGADRPRALEVQVDLVRDAEREALLVGRTDGPGWLDLTADLGRFAGDEVTLEVAPRLAGDGKGGDGRRNAAARLAWSRTFLDPGQESGREPGPGSGGRRGRGLGESGAGSRRPNLVLIVVDTLRADRLTPYGYERPTSPAIQSLLADRGVVVENAFAQAPWTVPSAVSYLTGRYPGEVLSGPMAGYGVPEGAASVPERLAALGYETAAFYGNFVLRDANGFGRGFATRYTPPAGPESNKLHADSVNRRALAWLAAHQHRPFFLYVHYMDPHDPYLSPELLDGRSPFFPDYEGHLTGGSVHGLYVGREKLRHPRRDLAHLSALYDSEVAFVDRAVGELLAGLDPEVAADTLFVFTSDHGEEIHDHGGFKHGHTLYQEMIRVPLIVRWDGRLPAGERLDGTAELVDLAPTLLAAAGGEPDPAWPGRDLLPALAGDARLPPRPAFAQHLASGPTRAAAVFGDRKLILFDREAPFAPADDHVALHWRRDVERLERVELYDLAADPAERENLASREPAAAAALAAVVHQRLDRAFEGLRVIASGLPAGARLGGRIVFERPPDAWRSYFLAESDAASLEGPVLTFDWTGEGAEGALAEKGVLVEGDFGALGGIEVRLDGTALDGGRVLLGAGAPYRGDGVTAAELAAASRPRAPEGGPALRLWSRPRAASASAGEVDPEVERSLRALGYIR